MLRLHQSAGLEEAAPTCTAAYAHSSLWEGIPTLQWRRRKFTTSIQPAKADEDDFVMLSGPHWPTLHHNRAMGP